MMRLDHDRSLSLLSEHLSCNLDDISDFVVWGNHSATQFPDTSYLKVKGEAVELKDSFIK